MNTPTLEYHITEQAYTEITIDETNDKEALKAMFRFAYETNKEGKPTNSFSETVHQVRNAIFDPNNWKSPVVAIDAQAIIDRLLTMRNCHHVIYDARTHYDEYVENVYPAEYHMWMDTPTTHGGERQCSCLARDEQEAKSKILSKFARHIETAYNKEQAAQDFADWINQGQKVENMSRRTYGPKAPVVVSLDKLLTI